jgi:hypothetical protein
VNLPQRIELLVQLGEYLVSDEPAWLQAQERAHRENGWFVPTFIRQSVQALAHSFLQRPALEAFAAAYPVAHGSSSKTVGLVMAGNLPLVGFHDLLCGWLAGHRLRIKPSSKDAVLMQHVVDFLQQRSPEPLLETAEQLKGCDAYIATGSNNSSRYFDYYFKAYPSIIRRNRTSMAILTGQETAADLEALSSDLLQYFGLGCRNVSKLLVPEDYDFVPLLQAMEPWRWMADHNKFRNNYDYNLALHILNNQYYMTNGIVLLVENEQLYSPISQVHFGYYSSLPAPDALWQQYEQQLQCLVGAGGQPFGSTQQPGLTDFADGVDTMQFLTSL